MVGQQPDLAPCRVTLSATDTRSKEEEEKGSQAALFGDHKTYYWCSCLISRWLGSGLEISKGFFNSAHVKCSKKQLSA